MVIRIKPNKPDAPNAAIAVRFDSGRQSRGVGDPERSWSVRGLLKRQGARHSLELLAGWQTTAWLRLL